MATQAELMATARNIARSRVKDEMRRNGLGISLVGLVLLVSRRRSRGGENDRGRGAGQPEAPKARGAKTITFVDSERQIRKMGQKQMTRQG